MNWFLRLLSGKPHFVIGNLHNPYMFRWYLIPRNHWLNIYLHKFLRDDDDRALHDHPWWFISFLIWGRYDEHTDSALIRRKSPSIAYRPAERRHRIALIDNKPAWTIVITGPKSREWGFWCPKGFVPWYQFVKRDNSGEVGPGCGE